MKQCPACKREMKEQLLFCPFDGQALPAKIEADKFIGTILDDKYRIEQKIGEGGMGKVYRAIHVHMDYTVALKILHSHLSSDQTALERFRREARATAQIRHPNAVAVTDFGVTRDTGIAYLVMEFLEGLELREKIKQERQLDYEESFLIVQQSCSALTAAHAKGIIHRDLKPDNIWLFKAEDGTENVKVLDFGIAKLKSASETGGTLTQQGMIVGTPYYMSPEQCRGEELDARSDVYSMGIILYEMLTGQVPFQAPTPIGVVLKHANELPKPPTTHRPDLPPSVEEVVLRALKKDKNERQGSALQLAQEYEMALYAAGIQLKQFGTSTPQARLVITPPGQSAMRQQTSDQATSDSKTIHAGTPATGLPSRSQAPAPTKPVASRQTPAPQQAGTQIMASDTPHSPQEALTGDLAAPRTLTAPAPKNTRVYLIAGVAAMVIIGAILAYVLSKGGDTATVSPQPPPVRPQSPATPGGMVLVKGGTFMMGTSDPAVKDADSKPAHSETVQDFFLDINEVTNADYLEFTKATQWTAPPHWKGKEYNPGDDKLPVSNVSWDDAQAYAQWAGKRLPTEAEWEYAARGKEGRNYPWGDEWSSRFSNSKEDGRNNPVAVGSYAQGISWCGIYDLAGNVAEWTADEFKLYEGSPGKAPTKRYKVYRGGAYNVSRNELMTWYRWYDLPNIKELWRGFRCAKDAPKAASQ